MLAVVRDVLEMLLQKVVGLAACSIGVSESEALFQGGCRMFWATWIQNALLQRRKGELLIYV